jgi:hypothetical protein
MKMMVMTTGRRARRGGQARLLNSDRRGVVNDLSGLDLVKHGKEGYLCKG